MDNVEVFKDIPHYGGRYQISNYGRVWSVNHQRILKPSLRGNKGREYYGVGLYMTDGRLKNELIHRLVAITFIDNPNHYTEVNHKDENKLNNCVDNLEWCDHKYNMNYGTRTERASISCTGQRRETMFKPVAMIDINDNIIKTYPSIRDANEDLGKNKDDCNISRCCRGIRDSAYGYRWKFI